MTWTGERNGEYRAAFATDLPGWYTASIEASRDGKSVGSTTAHVRAAPDDAEYFDAAMHAPMLRRIAEETGGRFYTSANMTSLPDDLKYSGRGVTAVEERELWHMPALLLVFLVLVCTEWGLRRAWKLA